MSIYTLVPRLVAGLGAAEQRSKTYEQYDARVAQAATTPSTKSVSRVGGSAGKQADAARDK